MQLPRASFRETPAFRAMIRPNGRTRPFQILAILILWVCIYGPGLLRPSLFDDADSAHAEAAREMLTLHDWVTLHENGIRYLEKAPLPYWAMAVSFKLFGIHEWSARLPQGLTVLALAFLLLHMGRAFLSAEAGFWAAIVSIASFGPYLFTRITIPDLLVGLWIALGLYFFLQCWRQERPSLLSCWGLAATVAPNVLTKGLIGLVFPCAIIFVFLLFVGDLRHLLRMRLLSSTLVFLLVAAPWHILAALRNPPAGQAKGFLWFYFVNEHFLRYIGKRYPVDYGTFPLILFWGMILVWLLPWSAFLPQAIGQIRLRLLNTAGRRTSQDATLLLFFLWAIIILLFFSFSTRQEYYLAPALPAICLLLGHWLALESQAQYGESPARAGRTSATAFLVVGLLIAAITSALAVISHPPPPGVGLADLLNKNPDVYVLSLGHFLDLTGSAMSLFRGPLIGTAVAFCLGATANWYFRRRGQTRLANIALAAMMIVFIECAHGALGVFAPVLGSKPLATAILKDVRPGDQIVCDGEYANASSVNFYTGRQMLIFDGRINGLWYGSLFPDAPPIFIDDAQLARLWTGATRLFFVTGDDKRRPYLEKLGAAYDVAQSGGKFVFTNRPATSATALP
jgi:4-amino-4-deoxy-L-arabinose transferase-like glycosyltransferase